MNLERGFRRVTFVLSIAVLLVVWFCFSEARFTKAQLTQAELKQDAEQYRRFWDCWDANDFCGASKGMIIVDLLSGPQKVKMIPVPDGNKIEVLLLDPNIAFPGIDQLRTHVDTFGGRLTHGILRISESALEEAAQVAKAGCIALEPRFSMYFGRTTAEMLTRSIFEGIPVAGGAFAALWVLFLISKWISCGFHSAGAKAVKTSVELKAPVVCVDVADEHDSRRSTREIVNSGVN